MKTKIYKVALLVIAIGLLLFSDAQQSNAQVTIYTQTFNAAYPNWPAGWTSSSVNGWVMDTSASNQSYVWNDSAGYNFASGGAMVEISNPDNGDTGTYTLTSGPISTVGYDSITLFYGARLTSHFADSGSVIKSLSWTNNGGVTWTPVTYTQVTNNSNWYAINDSTPIALSSGAANQDSIKFRWVAFIHSNTRKGAASGTYRIDDLLLSGDVSTGINNVVKANAVNLFPNPASSVITINNTLGKAITIRIINVTGQVLKTVISSDTQNKINVSNLDPGVYFVQTNDTNNNTQLQVIKLAVVR